MTAKDIENQLKTFTGGGSFVTCRQVTRFLNQTNDARVKQRYLKGLPVLEGTRSYFLPDVARNIYSSLSYDNCEVR